MGVHPLLGIFDSGVGGFSVLREVRKVSDTDIIYYGDCKNAPYGNRESQEIISLIKDILTYLKSKGATHFVSACNSMSVNTTEKLLLELGIKKENYIDMIDAVQEIDFPNDAKVLIVGTQATINSRVYQEILKEKNILYDVFVPTDLAYQIELHEEMEIKRSVDTVIRFSKEVSATHILYACTHYPLVDVLFKQQAQENKWNGVFVDPAVYIASFIKKWNISGSSSTVFETSKETEVFKKFATLYK